MFMYPYVQRPLAEVTGPGFAYSHHQLPAISTYTGNPPVTDPFYTRISGTPRPSNHTNETVSVLNRLLSYRQTLPTPYHCIAEISSFTMIVFPCVYRVHDVFLLFYGYILYTSTWTISILSAPSSLQDARRFSVGSSVDCHATL